VAQARFALARHNWGFYKKAWLRAEAWIRPSILQKWYDEIADDPASGTPTHDPTVFHRYFDADWAESQHGFRFWYKSSYTSPLTGEDWHGMIVCIEVVRGDPKLNRGHEKEMLTLIGKLLDAITEGLRLGRVVIERIPTAFYL
jgi:hypothetical protein